MISREQRVQVLSPGTQYVTSHLISYVLLVISWRELPEIVLSMLVKSFRFAPADVPVQWCLGPTMAPYESEAAQESKRPGLSLNVSVL